MADLVGEADLIEIMLRNVNEEIKITKATSASQNNENSWSKSLDGLPMFTIREIEEHRRKSGKNNNSIMKTTERGKKFKEERYLSANDIFSKD